jgi:hypothetical protein
MSTVPCKLGRMGQESPFCGDQVEIDQHATDPSVTLPDAESFGTASQAAQD